jgi:hypothetical protein
VEPHQIHVLARTVLGHLQQVDHAEKPRLNGEAVVDVLDRDLLDGIDLDFALVHRIAVAGLDVRVLPDADAAGDGSGADAVSETLREDQDGVEFSRMDQRIVIR